MEVFCQSFVSSYNRTNAGFSVWPRRPEKHLNLCFQYIVKLAYKTLYWYFYFPFQLETWLSNMFMVILMWVRRHHCWAMKWTSPSPRSLSTKQSSLRCISLYWEHTVLHGWKSLATNSSPTAFSSLSHWRLGLYRDIVYLTKLLSNDLDETAIAPTNSIYKSKKLLTYKLEGTNYAIKW